MDKERLQWQGPFNHFNETLKLPKVHVPLKPFITFEIMRRLWRYKQQEQAKEGKKMAKDSVCGMEMDEK